MAQSLGVPARGDKACREASGSRRRRSAPRPRARGSSGGHEPEPETRRIDPVGPRRTGSGVAEQTVRDGLDRVRRRPQPLEAGRVDRRAHLARSIRARLPVAPGATRIGRGGHLSRSRRAASCRERLRRTTPSLGVGLVESSGLDQSEHADSRRCVPGDAMPELVTERQMILERLLAEGDRLRPFCPIVAQRDCARDRRPTRASGERETSTPSTRPVPRRLGRRAPALLPPRRATRPSAAVEVTRSMASSPTATASPLAATTEQVAPPHGRERARCARHLRRLSGCASTDSASSNERRCCRAPRQERGPLPQTARRRARPAPVRRHVGT